MKKKIGSKEDGYIKNQKFFLKDMRWGIFFKISVIVIPIVVITAIFWGLISLDLSPDRWKHKEITYSYISEEYGDPGTRYLLNTTDGDKFVIPVGTKEMKYLSQTLVTNQKYNIIYRGNLGVKVTKALSSENEEFIRLDDSIAEWEINRRVLYIFVALMSILMVVGIVWSYFIWCKKERDEIKRINQKISIRLKKNEERNKRKKSQYNNEMIDKIVEILPQDFNLLSFDLNEKAFGNMIVEIASSTKKYTFITDRDEIYCNGKLLCDSSYRYTEKEDVFPKLLSVIKAELQY